MSSGPPSGQAYWQAGASASGLDAGPHGGAHADPDAGSDGSTDISSDTGPRAGPRHVTIIGAGIIGLASAAALARAGRSVTIIDALPAVGQGTSFGNGCQLSYGYVAPLAQPGVITELPQLLFARGAPLKIVPRLDPVQWRWLLQFLAACSPARSRSASLALLALGRLSQEQTDLWLQDVDPVEVSFTRSGKLVLLPSEAAFAKAKGQLALQAGHGPAQQPLSEAECLRLEPALARFRGRIAGAIHTPGECAVDSHALCINLERRLRERGVRFELGMAVRGFRRAGNRVTHVETDAGPREIDGLVIAAGPASAGLARQLGFSLPVYPLKGYSITARIVDPEGVPRASVTDAARKVVYARIGERLRVAGVVEIRGPDLSMDPVRIDELVAHTREAFGSAVALDSVSPWAGLRPATPTSVPIIGRSPLANAFVNVGQGALGLTLAFGSASRLAQVLDEA